MSSFTHPQVVPNLCEFLSSTKDKRYFEECSMSNVDFDSILSILWKSMATGNCLVTINILQNIFFCVQMLKETHRGLDQLAGE